MIVFRTRPKKTIWIKGTQIEHHFFIHKDVCTSILNREWFNDDKKKKKKSAVKTTLCVIAAFHRLVKNKKKTKMMTAYACRITGLLYLHKMFLCAVYYYTYKITYTIIIVLDLRVGRRNKNPAVSLQDTRLTRSSQRVEAVCCRTHEDVAHPLGFDCICDIFILYCLFISTYTYKRAHSCRRVTAGVAAPI